MNSGWEKQQHDRNANSPGWAATRNAQSETGGCDRRTNSAAEPPDAVNNKNAYYWYFFLAAKPYLLAPSLPFGYVPRTGIITFYLNLR
jgi:hypothetical protein